MNHLEIQSIYQGSSLPTEQQFQRWIDTVLTNPQTESEVVIRIVDIEEITALNLQYRHKQGATNILSFPVDLPDEVALNLLGDLVICAPVIESEAQQQHKQLSHHWAHIVIHGVLHLCGYDHIEEQQANEMEALEIQLLKKLTISNPYL